jgi:hypothetical protein
MTDNLVSRYAMPSAAARKAKVTLGLFAGGGALAALAAALRCQPVNGTQPDSRYGGNGALSYFTYRGVPSNRRSLRCASCLGSISPASPRRPVGLTEEELCFVPLCTCQAIVCASWRIY